MRTNHSPHDETIRKHGVRRDLRGAVVKRVCAMLVAVIVSQSVCVAFAASDETQTYSGTVLAAVNTEYTAARAAKTFTAQAPVGEPQAQAPAQSVKQPWTLLWEQTEPMTESEAAQAQLLRGGLVRAQRARVSYSVGDTRKIPKFPEMPDDYMTMTAKEALQWMADYVRSAKTQLTCVYTDDICTVWIEDTDAWSDVKIRELGTYVSAKIPQLEDLFGDVRIDTDGDGKFAIFIHAVPQSDAVVEEQGGTIAGYFSMLDLVDAYGRIGNVWMKSMILETMIMGAYADCFHINMEIDDLESVKTVFVHEYQHYIHECYCYAGKNNRTYLKNDADYIDEGFSVASEMILAPTVRRHNSLVRCFNAEQASFSLVTWEDHLVNYGLVYPFFQYIRTRYAALTGDTSGDYPGKGVYKRVLESRTRGNQDNTLGVIADILYPADRYASLRDTDARCRQLITDFWLAVYFKKPQGVYGFNGERWADDLCVRTETLEDEQSLRNGMAAFYVLGDGAPGTATVLKADDGIRFIAIDEMLRTVTLDPNGGTGEPVRYTSVQTGFTLPLQTQAPVFREGCFLCGWALSANADAPDYAPGDQIAVKDSVTLYAVWSPVTLLDAETSCSFDVREYGSSFTVQFCPRETGVYYVQSDTPYSAQVFDAAADVNEPLLCPDDGVLLQAGVTYTVSITFSFEEGYETTVRFALQSRAEYYTLQYYLSADSGLEAIQQYGTRYTVLKFVDERYGMDFLGWSRDPDAAAADVFPGDTITLSADTALYAVWNAWDALQPDVPYTVGAQSAKLRFVPDETAVYRVTTTPADTDYTYTVFSEENAINDEYTLCTQSRTFTMNAGETYYLFTDGIESLCVEMVSRTLQHSLYLVVYNGLNRTAVKPLSVELSGSSSYVLPDYRPVSLGCLDFEYWIDWDTGDFYYPGDTVTLDRDKALISYSTKTVTFDQDASVLYRLLQLGGAIVRYGLTWLRCLGPCIREFGLSGMRFSIPWLLL